MSKNPSKGVAMQQASKALDIIENINGPAPRHSLLDARKAEIDILQAHIDSGLMDFDSSQRALNTIKSIRAGGRRFA